jgi:hypothetical protein
MRRLAALWIALAFLLPLAAVDWCDDCLWGAADCCPPSCCPCCVQCPSALTAAIESGPSPVDVGSACEPVAGPSRSSDPRDVFHVPKSSLA